MKIELKELITSLDVNCKKILEDSAQRCIFRGGNEILLEDLLYVMAKNENSLLNRVFLQYKIEQSSFIKSIENSTKISTESTNPVFSTQFIGFLEEAYLNSIMEFSSKEIKEESFILTLIDNIFKYSQTSFFKFFEKIDSIELKNLIKGLNESSNQVENNNQISNKNSSNELEKYTTNLTNLAKEGKIDLVLCREDEIKQAIDILLRRRKNNPILVGEAGVGKTAIVEGLALKIIKKEVPVELYDAEILSLDIGALQAGASVKGEFERRLQEIIKQIQASTKFIILFIDEAHTLMGAGGSEGTSDAANLLKPALARGELKTIAATTWLEYRKYFEKDPALSRRFQKIDILEPSIEESITILRGIACKYEEVHNVYIEDDALKSASILSARYINGRQLPDKAIDVLDTACTNVKISKTNTPFEIQKLNINIKEKERELEFLQRDDSEGIKDYKKYIKELEKEIKSLKDKEKKLNTNWLKEKVLLEQINQEKDEEKLINLNKELKQIEDDMRFIATNVTKEEIAKVISSWTGIPLGNMVVKQMENVIELKNNLSKRVIGQDKAISYLNDFLQISIAGLKKENSPSGVFLLVGPSGVGKTETARAIADLLYGGEQFLTVINMTEFQEKHTVSRLIGSPPGYVGYGEGGQLTDPVRVKPYSVVLFDEIEKAHPDILNIFYQIFDRGEISDSEGRVVDFRNTTILMTSNLASDIITNLYLNNENIELEDLNKAILPTLTNCLKPALLGRMNVIPFLNLDDDAIMKIIKLKLDFLVSQFKKKNIELVLEGTLLSHLVSLCSSVDTGARNIDLVINMNILPKLSKYYLESIIDKKQINKIAISLDENKEIKIN